MAVNRLLENADFKSIICELFIEQGTREVALTATRVQHSEPDEYKNQLAQLHARQHLDMWLGRILSGGKQAKEMLNMEDLANG